MDKQFPNTEDGCDDLIQAIDSLLAAGAAFSCALLEDTWNLSRAEKAEAEPAALKARIAESCRADGQRVFDLLCLPIEYGGKLALVPVDD